MHTEDTLRAQIAQIDRLLAECAGNENLNRLAEHLKGRREATETMIEKIKKQEGAREWNGNA